MGVLLGEILKGSCDEGLLFVLGLLAKKADRPAMNQT
jgi:hypothetical protein